MMISRCSSPMPDRMVWPVSWSVLQAQRGILAGQLLQAERHLLDALLGLRLDRDVDHRDREGHALQHHRVARRSASVSPVPVSFSPTKAAMSPATTSLISSRLSACIWNMRPMRSRWPLVVFITVSPACSTPRVDAHEGQVPYLSLMILKARPAKGSSSRAGMMRRSALVLGALLGRDLDAGDVGRARQVVDHRVEQRLHALVLEGGAAEHRAEGAARSCPS